MKKFTLRYAFAGMLALAFAVTSCSDNNNATPDAPAATAPSTVTEVQISTESDIEFAVTIPGGFKSATAIALGGDATVKTKPADGAKTGSVVVTFAAGANAAVGSVTLTVADANSKTAQATAVISVVLKTAIPVTGIISTSTHWTADNKYLLKGNVYVQAPAELTIDAGTVIFGDKVTKGALIVSRGAKIHAVGNTENPIIFTSNAPKGYRNYGDWGGVVLLGFAQNNQSADQAIEGISAPTGDNGKHGIAANTAGTTENDNSGELQYARIEFAGIALSTDNELNGLTFGSVGSATKVDHIQVSYSGDDSYEWFGGVVNTTHLIAYRGWDDEFDTDFGYSGYNQFLVSFRDPNIADKSGSNGFESDNDAQGDGKTPQTHATFTNVTFFGPQMFAALSSGKLSGTAISANYKRGAHIRRNSALQVFNCAFAGANVDGFFFDQTSGSATVKGNYVARITGSAKPTPVANALVGGTVYDDSNFANDNIIEDTTIGGSATSVDLSAVFAGSTSNLWPLATPSALLANGSKLLENAKAYDLSTVTFPDGFGFDKTVKYIGAFDGTTNWASASWTNYDPNNTDY